MTAINPIEKGQATRRGVLFLGLTAISAGCLGDESTVYPLHSVTVSTDYDSDTVVEMSFEKGGEQVHEIQTEVPARQDIVVEEAWMGEAVEYTITVSHAETNRKSVSTSVLSERFDLQEDECMAILFEITSDGEIEVYLTGESCVD